MPLIDEELGNIAVHCWDLTWNDKHRYLPYEIQLLRSLTNAVGAGRMRQATRELVKAYHLFSLAKNTYISAEIYPYHKLLIVADGSLEVYSGDGYQKQLVAGESVLTSTDTPVGMRTAEGTIYTELSIRRGDTINEAIKAGENFHFAKAGLYSVKATGRL